MADQSATRPGAAAQPADAAAPASDDQTAAAAAGTDTTGNDTTRGDTAAGADVPATGSTSDATTGEGAAAAAELQAQVAEIEDRWRRSLADLDNLRKRVARDVEQQRAEERARVAAEWLPVLDNLDLALQHAEGDPSAVVEGVRAVRDQAVSVLGRLGFPRRDDLGAVFDPARHEAVSTASDTDAPEGTVVQVLRPGYGDDQRTLRPAAVVVATKPQ